MAKRSNGEGGFYRRKDGIWTAHLTVYDEHGRPKRNFLYAKTKSAVQVKLTEAIRARNRGEFATGDEQTVNDFLDWWIGMKSDIKAQSSKNYVDALGRLRPLIGHRRLRQLKRQHIDAAYSDLRSKYSPSTIQQTHAILHVALKSAVEYDHITRNPADGAILPRVIPKDMEPLTETEFLSLCRESRGTRRYAMWVLLGSLGLRHGEARALRWKDVDLDGHQLTISHNLVYRPKKLGGPYLDTPKSRTSSRTLALSPAAVAALKEHQQIQALEKEFWGEDYIDRDLVFPRDNGDFMNQSVVRDALLRDLTKANVRNMNPHGLRHMIASILAGRKVHPKVSQALLGHSNTRLAMERYTHLDHSSSDAVAEIMQEVLTSAPNDTTSEPVVAEIVSTPTLAGSDNE